MSRKKVSTTIYITPEQADRLKLLHERTKVPIAVYIREGIDMVLKHYEHVLPGQMTLEAAAAHPQPAVAMGPRALAPAPAEPAHAPIVPAHRREPAAPPPRAAASSPGTSRSGEGGG
jgi:predicted DNA-binding protein